MTVYDPAAVAAYVNAAIVNAGGSISDADLVKAVAIAGRESGWDSTQINPNSSTGDLSAGWFQANFYKDPNRFADIGIASPQAMAASPWNSAKAFAKLYLSSGFYAWGPYKGQNELTGVKPEVLNAATAGVKNARSAGLLSTSSAKNIIAENAPFGTVVGSGGGGGGGGGTGGDGFILAALKKLGIEGAINSGADALATGTGAVGDAVGALASPFSSVADLVAALGRTLFNPSWWKWVGIGAIGVMLLIGAMAYANKDEISGAAKTAAVL